MTSMTPPPTDLQRAKLTVPPGFAPDSERVADLRKQFEAAGVKHCFAAYTDIYGAPKAKATPLSAFEKMCKGAELYTVGAVEGLGLAGPHEDECAAVPDLDTGLVLPWDSTKAWFHADLYYHGEPYPNDPRRLLRNALAQAAEMGLTFNLGIEPEFYLYREDPDTGEMKPITKTKYHGPNACYDLQLTTESLPFLEPMTAYLEQLDWGLYSFDQECGQGQHEFDFGFSDALTSSDRLVFFRTMAKHVAAELDAVATFMPKPFAHDFRSGAHFNMSLADIESGDNVFVFDEANAGDVEWANRYGLPLSKTGYHFIAGLLKHAAAITAVACSTYNSYQGLIAQGALGDFSWAPVMQTYGHNNRSAMLRAPLNRPCVENRAVDMAVNPYLAATIMLHAGLEGIEQQLDPGQPFNNDLYQLDKEQLAEHGIKILPPTLLHALEAFDADPIAETALGSFKPIYLEHKTKEWEQGFYLVHDAHRQQFLTRL
ncbi:MAG: glutamine synthetase [Planctomycetota bacterium]